MQNPLGDIQRKRRIRSIFLWVVGIVILWLLLPFFSRLFFLAFSPVWGNTEETQTSLVESIRLIVDSKQTLVQENTRLGGEVRELKETIRDLELQLQENTFLQEQEIQTTMAVAQIYAKPPASPYDTFLVNKGRNDGLNEGDTLYASERIAIGIVEDSNREYARVRSFSYPGMEIDALLETGIQVTLRGEGAGYFTAELPSSVEVEIDTLVQQSIDTLPFIGVVKSIEVDETEGIQTIYVRQPINIMDKRILYFFPQS